MIICRYTFDKHVCSKHKSFFARQCIKIGNEAMNSNFSNQYEAILFVSFGAPEKPDDVLPFLRNVTRGRGVPEERLQEVAENYQMFGGKRQLHEQNKALIEATRQSLAEINLN